MIPLGCDPTNRAGRPYHRNRPAFKYPHERVGYQTRRHKTGRLFIYPMSDTTTSPLNNPRQAAVKEYVTSRSRR